jgi:hypothetical protein
MFHEILLVSIGAVDMTGRRHGTGEFDRPTANGRPVPATDQATNPFPFAAAPIGRVAREKQVKTSPAGKINLRFGS